jgi:hypothetical protein
MKIFWVAAILWSSTFWIAAAFFPSSRAAAADGKGQIPGRSIRAWKLEMFESNPPHERAFIDQVLLPNLGNSSDVERQNDKYAQSLAGSIPNAKGKSVRLITETIIFRSQYPENEVKEEGTVIDVQKEKSTDAGVAMIVLRRAAAAGTRCTVVSTLEINDDPKRGSTTIVLVERRFLFLKGQWKVESQTAHSL